LNFTGGSFSLFTITGNDFHIRVFVFVFFVHSRVILLVAMVLVGVVISWSYYLIFISRPVLVIVNENVHCCELILCVQRIALLTKKKIYITVIIIL